MFHFKSVLLFKIPYWLNNVKLHFGVCKVKNKILQKKTKTGCEWLKLSAYFPIWSYATKQLMDGQAKFE